MEFSIYLHENQRVGWNLFFEKNKRACPFIREVRVYGTDSTILYFCMINFSVTKKKLLSGSFHVKDHATFLLNWNISLLNFVIMWIVHVFLAFNQKEQTKLARASCPTAVRLIGGYFLLGITTSMNIIVTNTTPDLAGNVSIKKKWEKNEIRLVVAIQYS